MRLTMPDNLRRLGCSKAAASAIVCAFPGASLRSATAKQLQSHGATQTAARRVLAALALTSSAADAPAVRCIKPRAIATEIRRRFDVAAMEQEHMLAIPLDARQRVIDVLTLTIGTLANVDIYPRDVFRPLIRLNAHSLILAHNHPSGDSTPSAADIELTNRMKKAGALLGIPLLDHIIVAGDSGYTSLAELGLVE